MTSDPTTARDPISQDPTLTTDLKPDHDLRPQLLTRDLVADPNLTPTLDSSVQLVTQYPTPTPDPDQTKNPDPGPNHYSRTRQST